MMQPTSATLRAQSNKQTGPLDSSNDENPEMDFQNRFGHLNDKLRAYFVCEYQSDDLEMQSGRMYLSDRFICFDSNKPSFPQIIIPFTAIDSIVKKNTALVFANAIGIHYSTDSYIHTSMANRDKALMLLKKYWQRVQESTLSSQPDIRSSIKHEEKAAKPIPNFGEERTASMDDLNRHMPDIDSFEDPVPETMDISSPRVALERTNESSSEPSRLSSEIRRVGSDEEDTFLLEDRKDSPRTKLKKTKFKDRLRIRGSPRTSSSESLERSSSKGNLRQKPLDLVLLRQAEERKKKGKKEKKNEVAVESSPSESEIQPTSPDNVEKEINAQEEEPAPAEENADTPAEAPEVAVPMPSGPYGKHVEVDGKPIVESVFENLTIKEFYAKLLSNVPFWKHVLKEQENAQIEVPEMEPSEEAPENMFMRKVRFLAPIKGAPMGPKETRVIQTHRASCPSPNEIVFETVTQSLDIPMYGDAFLVETLWNITQVDANCRVQVRWRVNFIKSVWIKGMIEKNAKVATEASTEGWMELGKKWLANPVSEETSSEPEVKREDDSDAHTWKKGLPESAERSEVETGPVDIGQARRSFLESEFTLPLLGQKMTIRVFTILTAVFVTLCWILILSYSVSSLEGQVSVWRDASDDLHHRIQFLQVVTAHLAQNVSGNPHTLQQEWEYWKRTKGLDWRIAEWQHQMLVLRDKLSRALEESNSVLQSVHERQQMTPSSDYHLLNEAHLRELIRSIDTTKPKIHSDSHSSSWLFTLAYWLLPALLVGGGAFYARNSLMA